MRRGFTGWVGAALAAALAASVMTAGASAAPRHTGAGMSVLERGVLADINAFRAAHALPLLRLSPQLTASARQHTQEMAADGYFAHESVDGTVFWRRIQRYYASAPWTYWSVGENLLWSSPDVDAAGALKMWVASPEHLANLMNKNWREIGVSALHTSAAGGPYQGLDVTIVATDFGVRR